MLFAVGYFIFLYISSLFLFLIVYTARCRVMNVLFYRKLFNFVNVAVHYGVCTAKLALDVG